MSFQEKNNKFNELSSKHTRAIEFKNFIKKYEIKGSLVAKLLKLHINFIYQKIAGGYQVTDSEILALKLKYYSYLQGKLSTLEKDLKKANIIH